MTPKELSEGEELIYKFGLFGVLSLVGCASIFRFEPNGQVEVASKSPTCNFTIVSSPPSASDYLEIRTVNHVRGGVTSSTAEWKEVIRPEVCRGGGDLVVSEMNGYTDLVRVERSPADADGLPCHIDTVLG